MRMICEFFMQIIFETFSELLILNNFVNPPWAVAPIKVSLRGSDDQQGGATVAIPW